RVLHRILDPPRTVGREPKAATMVEAIDGFNQADTALLNQISERKAAAAIPLRDGDHQPQVGDDEPSPSIRVAPLDRTGESHFLRRGQKRDRPHLGEKAVQLIGYGLPRASHYSAPGFSESGAAR